MSIIFCNLCFEAYSQLKNKYFISSCSHVFCASCVSSLRNFCPICKTQCKMLEINQQLPSEVKMFFEDNSIERLGRNIQKIQRFQENQIKLYTDKQKPHREKYLETRKYIVKLQSAKKHYLGKLKAENELIKKLQNAYKTGHVTPDLFDNPSDEIQPASPAPSSRSGNSSNSSSSLKTSLSAGSSTRELQLDSPRISPSSSRPTFTDPRNNLLKATLHNMQKASQDKFLAMKSQQNRNRN